MTKTYKVAIVGVTGAVGTQMLKVLEKRKFPVSELVPLASKRSAGESILFNDEFHVVQETTPESFEGVDLALFSAGGSVSERFAHEAVKRGAIVIDNTSFFRMDENVPLVVPEVNPEDISKHQGIIANPNCSTIQMVHALKPIYDAFGIEQIIVSTYQSVSGTGNDAIEELEGQSFRGSGRSISTPGDENGNIHLNSEVYPHQIAFNLIPQIDDFTENGFTKEEMKMINETHKIFSDDDIKVTATCVRVPVRRGHSESVYIKTKKPFDLNEIYDLLTEFPNISVLDDPETLSYPMPLTTAGDDRTFVGRIRKDLYEENGLNLWIVSDNLLKGAALNAVQIAELLIQQK